jgi:hypothetical protein
MSIHSPFAIPNPPWLVNDGQGGDDPSDQVILGQKNTLFHPPPDESERLNVTTVENIAPGNAAFAARNTAGHNGDPTQPPVSGVFGLFGESSGDVASAGVLGSSAIWGVAGVSVSNGTIELDEDFDTGTGVFGVGDNRGVYGQCTPSKSQDPPDPQDPLNLSATKGSGVVGVGDNSGVFGISDQVGVQGRSKSGIGVEGVVAEKIADGNVTGIGVKGVGVLRGGVFQVAPMPDGPGPEFANVQLTPVGTNALPRQFQPAHYKPNPTFPDLPKNGKVGDLLVVQINAAPNDTSGVQLRGAQLWFCIKSDDQNLAQNATWARVQLEVQLTVP